MCVYQTKQREKKRRFSIVLFFLVVSQETKGEKFILNLHKHTQSKQTKLEESSCVASLSKLSKTILKTKCHIRTPLIKIRRELLNLYTSLLALIFL